MSIDNSSNNADIQIKLFVGCYEPDGDGDEDDPRSASNRYDQVVKILEDAGYDIETSYGELYIR